MKLMHYNVCFDSESKDMFVDIIAKEQPDILTLNEVSVKEIVCLQNKFLPIYFAPEKGKKYGNCVALKPPLNPKMKPHKEGFKTTLLELFFEKFSVYLTHLNGTGEEERLGEIERIIKLAEENDDYIIVGDLNSLAHYDNYDAEKITKCYSRFGRPLKHYVIPKLQQAGLVDILHKFNATQATMPTKSFDNRPPVRIDYIFATEGLASKVKEVYIVKNELTEQCSDHYPIIVDFTI